MLGASKESIPNLVLSSRGVEADMRVGRVECKSVTGAIENGRVQEGSERRTGRIDRGGCVQGVSIIFVRAISKGARIMPAMPAAETATSSDANGDGEESTSSPPAVYATGRLGCSDKPGSGRDRRAQRKDRAKDVIVDRSTE